MKNICNNQQIMIKNIWNNQIKQMARFCILYNQDLIVNMLKKLHFDKLSKFFTKVKGEVNSLKCKKLRTTQLFKILNIKL